MKALLKTLLIHHWPRKCLALVLAIITWFLVENSLKTTTTVSGVPVHLENLPAKKLADTGSSPLTIDLTLTGRKKTLNQLNSSNLFLSFNAENQDKEWIVTVKKEHIRTTIPNLNIMQEVHQVGRHNVLIKLVDQVTEHIPITIGTPIGKPPLGYELVEVWPKNLYVTVTGSEKEIASLKTSRINLSFNLNKIDKEELDLLSTADSHSDRDVVSFSIPSEWKKVTISPIHQKPVIIDDPRAKELRIDFLRKEILPISFSIPISLYFPRSSQQESALHNTSISPSKVVQLSQGIPTLALPLYAKGVSPLFLEIIKEMLTCVIVVPLDATSTTPLSWSWQLVNQNELENRYVKALLDPTRETREQALYLRTLFRSYVYHLQLWTSETQKLELQPTLVGDSIVIQTAP